MKRPTPYHSNAVWPPVTLVVLFVLIYGVLEGGLLLIRLAAPNAMEGLSDMPEIRNIRAFILASAAGVYAVYRLWRFHPACRPAYAAWLALSPWTARKPLPLGPVHPVWQDAAVIGVLSIIAAWHAHVDPALPAGVFGLVYLVGMTLLLARTRRWRSCFLLGVLWPALILPDIARTPAAVAIVALIAVVWYGYRQSLRAFPWNFLITGNTQPPESLLQTEIRIDLSGGTNKAQFNVGWPLLAISPKIQNQPLQTQTSIALSTLIGWWSFCIIKSAEMEPLPELILLVAVFAAAFRLVIYCSRVTTPFNLWGRFVSGRIVVPGFDKVFATPLATVLVAILGGIVIRRSGSWYPLTEACVIALIWFILFSGGPTLRNWLLTGGHRFRLPTRVTANKQLLRPV